MPIRAIQLFFEAVGDFLRTWQRLLATDVVYKLIAVIVLTPLAGGALQLFMVASGGSVLADQDILYFFLSPIGLAALVVVGAAALAITSLEQACLMVIGFGEVRGLQVGTLDALRYGARHAGSVVVMALRILVKVLLIAAPFLAACGLTYLVLLRKHDINFYLAEKPPVFFLAAGIIVALLGVAAVRVVRRAQAAGKEVYVWTVNDRLNMSRLMSRGVDGIITDRLALAREVLAARANMSAAERLVISAAFWMGLDPQEPPAENDLGPAG